MVKDKFIEVSREEVLVLEELWLLLKIFYNLLFHEVQTGSCVVP